MNPINYEELDYQTFKVENDDNVRLDKFLVNCCPSFSRNYIQDLIKDGYVFVNNKQEKPSYHMELNDEVIVYFKLVTDLTINAENIPLDIIYQDEDIAIINKEAGMVVHPSPGHQSGTLVNAILYHIHDLSGINGVNRPGIVHRIDKDTSGLIAIAKNDKAHEFLANQLKDHSMHRSYYALAKGIFESKKGIIKTLIARDSKNRLKQAVVNDNGKEAITEFEVVETFKDKFSLVKLNLKTGRTHQIRVHLAFIKHPIINDPLYGENNKVNYDCAQLLHAYQLTLIHPSTLKEMTFTAPLPKHFNEVLEMLKK